MAWRILLKYLSDNANVNTKVSAAAAVSVPVDLRGSALELDNGFNRIYMQRFLSSLNTSVNNSQLQAIASSLK